MGGEGEPGPFRGGSDGRFVYDHNGSNLDLADRTLAHLEVAIVTKLRRGEPFLFSWSNDVSLGSGRQSVWVSPSSTLSFRYSGGRPPVLNRAWVDDLVRTANSARGLRITPEPDSPLTS